MEPGEVLGDRYVLRKTEWSTPLGHVWLARDRVLDRPVFVQMLEPADPAPARAFERAAAHVAQVTHPGLLQVFDIGEKPPFAVFEHASGGRLAERLRAGALRPMDGVRAAIAIARGLEALHERGAWHGHLSPATVLFDEEGRAKILANGAVETARAAPSIDALAEQPEAYRPPEPDAMPADADRYALAATVYQMITGRAPQRPYVPARTLRREIPQAVDDLLRRALASDPRERPSLDEFVGSLAPFARVQPRDARVPRFSTSEFRWLIPVIVVIALAVAAVTVGVQFVRDLAEREETKAEPTAAGTSPAGQALRVEEVSDFDPPPGNGEEHPEKAPLAIDGDARTSWRTVGYNRATLDGQKTGVGLLFDLGSAQDLRRARVQSTLGGWEAQIRAGDAAAQSADDFRTVTTFTASTENVVSLPLTRARYVLLWITKLVDGGGESEFPFGAEVAEVEFFAA